MLILPGSITRTYSAIVYLINRATSASLGDPRERLAGCYGKRKRKCKRVHWPVLRRRYGAAVLCFLRR